MSVTAALVLVGDVHRAAEQGLRRNHHHRPAPPVRGGTVYDMLDDVEVLHGGWSVPEIVEARRRRRGRSQGDSQVRWPSADAPTSPSSGA
jgi:hypothetical protein